MSNKLDQPEPNKTTRETSVPGSDGAPCSASFGILRQALDDGAFDGSELAVFDEYTVSWDTVRGIVAIADDGGWWTMDARQLKAIAAATPVRPNLEKS
jgi:hypothetical protein